MFSGHRGGAVGLADDALEVGDQVGVGGQVEEVAVAPPLGLDLGPGLAEGLVGPAELLDGDPELLHRGLERLEDLGGAGLGPGRRPSIRHWIASTWRRKAARRRAVAGRSGPGARRRAGRVGASSGSRDRARSSSGRPVGAARLDSIRHQAGARRPRPSTRITPPIAPSPSGIGVQVTRQRIGRPRRLVASSVSSRAGRLAGQAGPDRRLELVQRQADVEVQQVLAADLVGPEPPEVLGPGVPDLDQQVLVDDDHAAAEAAEDRLEEDVDPVQLLAPDAAAPR